MKWTFSYLGAVASLGCMLLICWFLFWNPYSETAASRGTIGILLAMLLLPAMLGLIGSLTMKHRLIYIAFFWSLPYGLYFSVASLPSIWNLFIIVLALYLVSAIQIGKVRIRS
ncbi:hypothetical protein A8709_04530 [Paenibacillus pectinilyticus]|uniref:Uncharacterized protein n=1 Tax=Paenibacillus pectinilyticus TaxID=512399 RepID=A0A1C0ZSC0_9BACL|nr:hypothetical protein [Paenibacillus pectinilyticus]OCT10975.1 hypothetical protein A8709_04530 [Paenibacillus pectinilyticus]